MPGPCSSGSLEWEPRSQGGSGAAKTPGTEGLLWVGGHLGRVLGTPCLPYGIVVARACTRTWESAGSSGLGRNAGSQCLWVMSWLSSEFTSTPVSCHGRWAPFQGWEPLACSGALGSLHLRCGLVAA